MRNYKYTIRRLVHCVLVTAVFCVWQPQKLFADSIILKDGRKFYNVKTVPDGTSLYIISKSGRTYTIKFDEIKETYLKPVRWFRKQQKQNVDEIVKKAVKKARKLEQARFEKELTRLRKSRTRFVWRSLLLPGLGQFHENKNIRGWFFLSVFTGSILNYADTWQDVQDARYAYNSTPFFFLLGENADRAAALFNFYIYVDNLRNFEQSKREENNAIRAVGLVWLINVLDSLLLRKRKSPPVSGERGAYSKFDLSYSRGRENEEYYQLLFRTRF